MQRSLSDISPPGLGSPFKWVSSGSKGEIWAVNNDGNGVLKRNLVTKITPFGNGWTEVGKQLAKVSVFEGQAWGLGVTGGVYNAIFTGKALTFMSQL